MSRAIRDFLHELAHQMPLKRYHRKSRAGCDTCRRRRVKCDEATPTCEKCAHRGDHCRYTPVFATATAKTLPQELQPRSFSLYSTGNSPASTLLSRSATRAKEMQLMHQWSTATYLSSGHRNTETFRDYMVSKSLECTYLLDILLAFTSLHSASKATGANDAQEHVITALHYQNQSIAEVNRAQVLVNISEATCDPVILTVTLNALCALVASLVPATRGEQLESSSEILLRVHKYMRDMTRIGERYREWVANGELAKIFPPLPVPMAVSFRHHPTTEKVGALCNAVLAILDLDDVASPVFRDAIVKLEKAHADSHGRSVFPWLLIVDPALFQKAGLGEPAALVILVCWGTLTFVLENLWWTKFVGRRIVEDLSSQLIGCDEMWSEVLGSCYEEVGISSNMRQT